MKRIGFACKWIDRPDQVNGINAKDSAKQFTTGSTTVAWLNRQSREVAEQKLWDLMIDNIESTERLIKQVGKQDELYRFVRISSDILPVFTERSWNYFWLQSDVRRQAEKLFSRVGNCARDLGVRLSMHPGQFCVLASDNPNIVERSLAEFEYHATMARWMGYGKRFQDFKINIHISGRQGPDGIRRILPRLTPEARNCITVENEENAHGLDIALSLSDCLPIVLDLHHHWVREGEYIQPNDKRIHQINDSWRGNRPVAHYSVSREDVLVNHNINSLPDHKLLLESGIKRQKLRAHSDFYWNKAANNWALSFLDQFDIMCESKGKNLASFNLK